MGYLIKSGDGDTCANNGSGAVGENAISRLYQQFRSFLRLCDGSGRKNRRMFAVGASGCGIENSVQLKSGSFVYFKTNYPEKHLLWKASRFCVLNEFSL